MVHPAGVSSFVVERHPDVTSFLAVAGDWLAAREAEHNLPLAILGSIQEDPTMYGPDAPYLATVHMATDPARPVAASAQRSGGWCEPERQRQGMDPGASGPNGTTSPVGSGAERQRYRAAPIATVGDHPSRRSR